MSAACRTVPDPAEAEQSRRQTRRTSLWTSFSARCCCAGTKVTVDTLFFGVAVQCSQPPVGLGEVLKAAPEEIARLDQVLGVHCGHGMGGGSCPSQSKGLRAARLSDSGRAEIQVRGARLPTTFGDCPPSTCFCTRGEVSILLEDVPAAT